MSSRSEVGRSARDRHDHAGLAVPRDGAPRVQSAVDDANKAVSKAESIRKFSVLDEDFTEENGTLTPSMKLKRNIVMRDYAEQIEALYG